MSGKISISLPEDLRRDLDRAAADNGVTRSELVSAALRAYLGRPVIEGESATDLERLRSELLRGIREIAGTGGIDEVFP